VEEWHQAKGKRNNPGETARIAFSAEGRFGITSAVYERIVALLSGKDRIQLERKAISLAALFICFSFFVLVMIGAVAVGNEEYQSLKSPIRGGC
jgi:hypothetical protein